MPSACRACASALVEADPDEHLNCSKRGDAHFAINVINNMQVDDNRFASYVAAAVPDGRGRGHAR